MHEGYNPNDELFDVAVPSTRLPLKHNGVNLVLTPENTRIRLFGEGLLHYSRAIVEIDDGTTVDATLDEGLLNFLSNAGYPTTRPEQPETEDEAFLDSYINLETQDLSALPETG